MSVSFPSITLLFPYFSHVTSSHTLCLYSTLLHLLTLSSTLSSLLARPTFAQSSILRSVLPPSGLVLHWCLWRAPRVLLTQSWSRTKLLVPISSSFNYRVALPGALCTLLRHRVGAVCCPRALPVHILRGERSVGGSEPSQLRSSRCCCYL